MTPTHQPTLRIVSSTAAATGLIAVTVFTLTLISTAAQLSHAAVPATVQGPLGLFVIQKLSNPGGGYQASIALQPGFYALAAAWLIATAALSFARLRRQTSSS